MGDGGPIVTGPQYVRDPNWICDVCGKRACCPRNHIDEVLSDDNARRFAQVILDDGGLTGQRAKLLARYILSLPRKKA